MGADVCFSVFVALRVTRTGQMVCPILVPGINEAERNVATACNIVAMTWYHGRIETMSLNVFDCGHQFVSRYIMYNAFEKIEDGTT